MSPDTQVLYRMSPLKLVRPTMAPEVTVACRVGESELEQEEGEKGHLRRSVGGRDPVEGAVLMADDTVSACGVEGKSYRPVEQAAEAGGEDALEENVHRLPRSGEPSFEAHEGGLHEEHEEGGDEDPDGVDRAHEVLGHY